MKKNHRILTTKQIVGAALLLLMVGGVEIFMHVHPQRQLAVSADADSLFVNSYQSNERKSYTKQLPPIRRRVFDPNTADSITLLEQGFWPGQVGAMMKYRRKGGHWKDNAAIAAIPYIDDSLYHAIEPYLSIDTTLFVHRWDTIPKDSLFTRYVSRKRDTIIELNSADTVSLQCIRGIGKYMAARIVFYRSQLGGYARVEQVREVPGLEKMNLDSVLPHLRVEPDSVKPIMVNSWSVDRMQRHPYLRFEQAQAIYDLRRRNFQLESIDQLRELDQLSDEDIQRLRPYLSFVKRTNK